MFRSLRARVTLGFVAIALTLLLVSAVAVDSLRRLGGEIETILRENYRSVIACVDMEEALERQDSAAQFASTGHDDIARPMLAAQRAAFARAYAVELSNITLPGEGEAVRGIDVRYRDYVDAVDRALAVDAGAARTERYFRELLPRFTRLEEATGRVLRMNQAGMEAADRSAKAAARRGVAITYGVGALALALLIAFTWWLPRMIVRPVQRLADAARAVGCGDLDVEVADTGVRELAPLTEAFRRMVEKLRAYRQSSLGELLAARDLANVTVQCLLDPTVVFGRDGAVLLSNEAARRTFEIEAGDPPAAGGEGALGHVFGAARERAVATGEVVAPGNLAGATRWRDRLGERYFQVRATPLRAEADDGRVIVVAQDVTRLTRIDRLKSDMVATVSHEFKTPLTSLRMATHLLLEPGTGPLTDAQREVVTTARDETERLRALVDELLDLVRIESDAGALHRVSVEVDHLLRTVVDGHRAIAAAAGVALEVEAHGALAPARVDPEKLGIVLSNLVSNAIRHTPAGGRVTLGAGSDPAALRITVRDSGEGVVPTDLARLLERSTTRGAHEGRWRGLGLTIAQEIVLQHGGELLAESAVGRGSAFTVVIPHEPERAG
ncbi:MAG: two-component sensor histidine kinase [Myxococcaceae bacterium]|nr:two-component sensor histidine kinase [Myxococcaceae bacterium]